PEEERAPRPIKVEMSADAEPAPRRRSAGQDGPIKTKIRGDASAPSARETAPAPRAAPAPRETPAARDATARPARNAAPRPETREEPRQEPRQEPRRRDDDDGPKVKGLGDHVPAFLMRPVKVG
ncbi:MAG: hypothetical protein ACK4VM_17465, partial [Bosea sp. (in: a-proteobacteria)]